MSFRYNPITAEQAEESRSYPLLKAGEYKFVVSKAEFKTSKALNPMIELTLLIHVDGQEYKVFDYLIASETMEWKTRHFCDACGLLDFYQQGQFNEKTAHRKIGYAYIGLEEERPKNDGSGGVWKAKNKVEDYVKQGESKLKGSLTRSIQPDKSENDFNDSDIPF